MANIHVDFEVFKEITARRVTESITENDVIRELLGLSRSTPEPAESGRPPWVIKGVAFPQGTKFRTTYKGQQYTGKVENGALEMNSERFTSPSAAASSITGGPVNGWRFWECLRPNASEWELIANLRK